MKTKTLCPCNRRILPREMLGIIAYYHETDDTPCHSVNLLSMTTNKILKSYYSSTTNFTPAMMKNMVPHILVSKDMRKEVYDLFSRSTDGTLYDLLTNYIDVCVNVSGKIFGDREKGDELIKEVISNFGEIFIENAKIATGYEFSSRNVTLKKNLLSMQKLSPAIAKSKILGTVPIKNKRLDDIIGGF